LRGKGIARHNFMRRRASPRQRTTLAALRKHYRMLNVWELFHTSAFDIRYSGFEIKTISNVELLGSVVGFTLL
jgi:hypothetical protein